MFKEINAGDKFGKLTVIKCVGYPTYVTSRINYYACLCECGKIKEIRRNHLLSRKTVSCGCYRKSMCRKAPGETSYTTLYNVCKQGAKHRGLDFCITENEHRQIIKQNCHYCAKTPSSYNVYLKVDGSPKKQRSLDYSRSFVNINGIDRKNNNLGYTIENCVPCCRACNIGKWESSCEDYVSHCQRVVEYQASLGRI